MCVTWVANVTYVYIFFFNDTATTEIYTLSLHDALPISRQAPAQDHHLRHGRHHRQGGDGRGRSEEHTSELQSRFDLVCRLLLEKKNKNSTALVESKAASPAGMKDVLPTSTASGPASHRR